MCEFNILVCSFFEDLKTDVLMISLFQKTVQRYRGEFFLDDDDDDDDYDDDDDDDGVDDEIRS